MEGPSALASAVELAASRPSPFHPRANSWEGHEEKQPGNLELQGSRLRGVHARCSNDRTTARVHVRSRAAPHTPHNAQRAPHFLPARVETVQATAPAHGAAASTLGLEGPSRAAVAERTGARQARGAGGQEDPVVQRGRTRAAGRGRSCPQLSQDAGRKTQDAGRRVRGGARARAAEREAMAGQGRRTHGRRVRPSYVRARRSAWSGEPRVPLPCGPGRDWRFSEREHGGWRGK